MWLGTDGIYHHSVRKFGHSDFGYGYESTSHIESVCGNLKNIIKRIYYPIPNNNFVLFLKEAEFRREISGFANNIKWQNFVDIILAILIFKIYILSINISNFRGLPFNKRQSPWNNIKFFYK